MFPHCSLILATSFVIAFSLASTESAYSQTFQVRTTAYTHTEDDHLVYGRSTASGTTLRAGARYTSAAADWSRFPLGTTFRIKGDKSGTIYVIDDYGIALVGTSTIDIYCPTKEAMNRWGVRHIEIEILETGDIERSRRILASRKKWRFVNAMHSDMTRSGG